jgi:hypothetical protein
VNVRDVTPHPLGSTVGTLEWQDQASCQSHPEMDALFFDDPRLAGRAKNICAGCPVKTQCFEDCEAMEVGLQMSSLYGIRAGETPIERWRRRVGIPHLQTAKQKHDERRRLRRALWAQVERGELSLRQYEERLEDTR